MTRSFVPLPRFAALSAVIALFASPISINAAQTPVPSPAGDAPAPTVVLNAAAFARLAKLTQPDVAPSPTPDVRDRQGPQRLESLPHSPMATVRRADAAIAKPPVRSRSVGQKVMLGLMVAGIIAGALAISLYTGADFDQMVEGLLVWVSK